MTSQHTLHIFHVIEANFLAFSGGGLLVGMSGGTFKGGFFVVVCALWQKNTQ